MFPADIPVQNIPVHFLLSDCDNLPQPSAVFHQSASVQENNLLQNVM